MQNQTEHPAKLASILSALSDEEINAMPRDDFADALFAEMATKEPLLTCDDMDEIEATWERQRRNRRAALVLLTKPWAWLNQRVIEDRDFAVAVAQIKMLVDEVELYKGLARLMEEAKAWSMIALVSREDMDEVIQEAKAFE